MNLFLCFRFLEVLFDAPGISRCEAEDSIDTTRRVLIFEISLNLDLIIFCGDSFTS